MKAIKTLILLFQSDYLNRLRITRFLVIDADKQQKLRRKSFNSSNFWNKFFRKLIEVIFGFQIGPDPTRFSFLLSPLHSGVLVP